MQDLVYSVNKIVASVDRVREDTALEGLIKERIKKEQRAEDFKNRKDKVKKFASSYVQKYGRRIAIAATVLSIVLFIILVGGVIYKDVIYPKTMYSKAIKLMEDGYYNDAISILQGISEYKDSSDVIKECEYEKAERLFKDKQYEAASKIYSTLANYNDSHKKYTECFVQSQLADTTGNNYDLKMKTLSITNSLDQDQAYRLASYFFNLEKYAECLKMLERCGEYNDSVTMIKEAFYEQAINKSTESTLIVALKELADGSKTAALLGQESIKNEYKSDKAAQKLDEVIQPIYQEAEEEYNKTNWGNAKDTYKRISGLEYKDVETKIDSCQCNIENEKARYNGIWINTAGWTHLKIENGKIWDSSDDKAKQDKKWESMSKSSFDENTGELTLMHWTGDDYLVTISGNTLKLIWLTKDDQWDSDWFSFGRTFKKSNY